MQHSFDPSFDSLAAAAGCAGYVWDIDSDALRWFGNSADLFSPLAAPATGAELMERALPEDRAQVLSTTPHADDSDFRFPHTGHAPRWIHRHSRTDAESRRQIGLLTPRAGAPAAEAIIPTDHLTGRLNRAGIKQALDSLLATEALDPRAVYFVVGIDKMAFMNEALGHQAADTLLCDVAHRLQTLGPADMKIGRVAGDSFGLLMSGHASTTPDHMARQILADFRDNAFTSPLGPLHVSVSIGSAAVKRHDGTSAEIMIRAEQALREARNRGRNRHIGYLSSSARAEESRSVLEIGERVQQALRHDHLHLAYQPVVDAETGEVLFYEALARLSRDDGQLMLAADFIPVVEQQGLAPVFDRHVLNLAIKELDASPNVRLAVNISGLTAALPDWPDYMHGLLAPRPKTAERLIIEITETAAILEVAETKVLVDSLRALGSQVALDDFGAGSTSIRHLRALSLAIMKIDKDLLENLLVSPEQQHLVRMLISIARGLGLKTVAEGIESADVAAWLRDERVDMMQGYYFGYPSLEKPWVKNPNPIFLKGSEGAKTA
jgi:diguanylate cyclase (GGDEF)-like protein